MSRASLTNHRKNHLSRQLLVSQKNRDIFTGETLMSLIQGWLTTSERILKECEKKKRYGVALKAMAQGRATAQFFFEVSVKLQEIKIQEQRAKEVELGCDWSRLSTEELKIMQRLYMKAMNKQPGRRTDLIKRRKAREAQARHKAKKAAAVQEKADENVRKMKRRKITPKPEKPINEFDAMRSRLNMSNSPENERKVSSWSSP